MLFGYTLYSFLAQYSYYAMAALCLYACLHQFLSYWQMRRQPSVLFHAALSFCLASSFLFAGAAERTSSISNAVSFRFASVLALDVVILIAVMMLVVYTLEMVSNAKSHYRKD
jgi:uncharacterized membrane protein